MKAWKPDGYPSLSPYLVCPQAEALIAFLQQAFEGTLVRRFDREDGSLMHAEVRLGDSIVMIGGGATDTPAANTHLHLYVPDVEKTFARMLHAGAQVVQQPVRKHDADDLRGGARDRWGNTWWIATQ